MIYLQLFFTFFKVGIFAFGGGYAMLSLIGEEVLAFGWMNQEELLNFVGVETVIPGPIAVNMATYVGYEQGGFPGAFLATLGVVLPSFVIILVVAVFIKNLLKYPSVKVFIASMRPALAGLIASVAITMGVSVLTKIETKETMIISVNWRSLIILAIVILIPLLWKRYQKKEFSSILLVILSGFLGMIIFY